MVSKVHQNLLGDVVLLVGVCCEVCGCGKYLCMFIYILCPCHEYE